MELKELLDQKLKEKFSGENFIFNEYRNELTLSFDKKNVVSVCKLLKEDPDLQFKLCEDITAVDWAKRKDRFTVVYHIFSLKLNLRLALKANVDEADCNIDSVCCNLENSKLA